MTTLVPNSQASGVETYEDMFKEITKKLYGDTEASQSLHTPMAHAALDVERSFTNLVSSSCIFRPKRAKIVQFQSILNSEICTAVRSECDADD